MINTARLRAYRYDASPERTQFWTEIAATRYQLRTNERTDRLIRPRNRRSRRLRRLPGPLSPRPATAPIRAVSDNETGW